MEDYNKGTREQFDQEFSEATDAKLLYVHTKLGLAWDMYPYSKAHYDTTGVIESSAKLTMDCQKLY